MFAKKFVSLYFSSEELRVVQLNPKQNKVKVATTVPIPKGTVTNRQVDDEEALSNLIKAVWTKLKIKEKSVGLVIPEFSTFTKTITFPKVDRSEIDEAVTWQAQEHLPWSEEDTVLDWKIIGETKKDYKILFVAVRKDVLLGYVNAASKAGLFPVVVETPSLSLVRLSKTGEKGKLIFYGGNNSGIYILTNGQEIKGSSVVYSSSLDNLLATAEEMAMHYKNVTIESIEIGGPGGEGDFAQKLSQLFKIEPTLLGGDFKGISKDHINKYLIPLSLQLKDPAEPSDQITINLLPSKWVKKYEFRKLQLQIWGLTLLVSYIVWVAFFATLAAYIYMSQQITKLSEENRQFRTSNPEKVKAVEQIQAVNANADKILSISNATIYPQDIINDIYAARPEKISINTYEINLESGQISIDGFADDRLSFLSFKQALESVDNFSIVISPIASLEVEENVPFTMEFSYLPLTAQRKK